MSEEMGKGNGFISQSINACIRYLDIVGVGRDAVGLNRVQFNDSIFA